MKRKKEKKCIFREKRKTLNKGKSKQNRNHLQRQKEVVKKTGTIYKMGLSLGTPKDFFVKAMFRFRSSFGLLKKKTGTRSRSKPKQGN